MTQNIEQYLRNFLPNTNETYKQIEKQAVNDRIPIMEPTSMHFLTLLLRLIHPKRLLEIGTGIGYSALKMAEACESCEIITLENDYKRYKQAIANIAAYEQLKQIEVIHCDALEYLASAQNKQFDVVFIDAAKGEYKQYFKLADPLLANGGLIISDNILFRGYVAHMNQTPKRYKRIVESIQNYNKWLANHPSYVSSFLPIGDGVAISFKINK